MLTRFVAVFAIVGLLAPVSAREGPDRDVEAAIREEAETRSQIMRTVHFLTDVYGPRVTGSPNLKAAGQWAVATLGSWGMTQGRLEPWEFGHPGWVNERLSAHMTAPVQDALTTEALAWTPGTSGTVTAQAVHVVPPDRPTPGELAAFLERLKSSVRRRIVLVGPSVVVPVDLNPPAKRTDDERVRAQFDPDGAAGRPRRAPAGPAPPMTPGQISRSIDDFLVAHGAVLRINDAGREHGQIAAFHNSTYDLKKVVPTVVMRNEDYGRIARILADGTPVQLEFNIVNRTHPDGRTAYNAVAEIEGSDKRSELVMLGAHLDSWQAGTGATDNAIGCAIVMEAVRILKAIGVQPRRTIRVALWSGEEEGLLGSQAYVRRHFGSAEHPTPSYGLLSAYLNLDGGTGRIRGAEVFGPPAAATMIREALARFAGQGVAGAIATRRRYIGGTDHTSFNVAGLPGINFRQDPIEYDTHTHHTNLDTYERVLEADAKMSAAVIAATVYRLAMSDEMLPRFARGDLPPVGER